MPLTVFIARRILLTVKFASVAEHDSSLAIKCPIASEKLADARPKWFPVYEALMTAGNKYNQTGPTES